MKSRLLCACIGMYILFNCNVWTILVGFPSFCSSRLVDCHGGTEAGEAAVMNPPARWNRLHVGMAFKIGMQSDVWRGWLALSMVCCEA
ncbi:hypothetical protein B0T22DRAFT_469902 [Podospora appendiculata]|uniref:Uncharacterized protein n=1 Tax=Podospora appendiculata TaxID=314037 RepID=A0AAE0X3W9_9PEZI|nr:hypothetical protein B0T22DRAFT_469902 [Podospora appendiculata]